MLPKVHQIVKLLIAVVGNYYWKVFALFKYSLHLILFSFAIKFEADQQRLKAVLLFILYRTYSSVIYTPFL